MGTRFKANAGTQPNAAGLEQIPAGSNRLPQGYLNGIGRKIDRATVRFSGDFLFQTLPGGTVLQPVDVDGTAGGFGGEASTLPFQISLVEAGPTTITIKIAEGHIIGRTDSSFGNYVDPPFLVADQVSLGLPGINFSMGGGWPGGGNPPDTSAGNNPTSSGTQEPKPNKDSGGVFNKKRDSGGGGSVIDWNHPGAIHRNPRGSGNAGSIIENTVGSGGIYHTQRPSGAAGNINTYPQIYNRPKVNGVYVNPPKE